MLELPDVVNLETGELIRMYYHVSSGASKSSTVIQWIEEEEAKGLVVSTNSLVAIREGLHRVMESSWWEWQEVHSVLLAMARGFPGTYSRLNTPWISGQPAP
jgi:hypothetical protein